ncbi:MAG: radical SAM/SPASM domain-containing protein [Candidatus Hydrothermarchaeota archaeon]
MFAFKALANIIKSRYSPVPLVICHNITYKCNLRCKFCRFWRIKPQQKELTFEEIQRIIDESRELGAIMYNVWGTEPLMREDLLNCLSYAKEKGLRTCLITNGILLENRVKELSKLIDYLIVSVDGLDDTYEKIRGINFRTILRALEKVKEYKIKTTLNYVICGLNLGGIRKTISFANDMGFYISFEPVHYFPEIEEDWEEIKIKDQDSYIKAIETIIEMKKEGYKIANSFKYLSLLKENRRDFRCSVGNFLLHIEPDGSVYIPCGKWGKIGSARENSLRNIWFSSEAKKRRNHAKDCRDCLFSGYIESSLLYSFNLSALKNFFMNI